MLRSLNSHRGATLIELQITAVISIIVGGISFFTLFRSQNAYHMGERMADLQFRVRKSMDRLVEDIRLAGFGLVEGDTAFFSAKENEVIILADMDDDGDVDTVRYYLSESSEMGETLNPNDRILYKSVNGSSPGLPMGTAFTSITFDFFDKNRQSLLDPSQNYPKEVDIQYLKDIRLITLSLIAEMENPDSDGQYRSFVLNSSMNPRNPIILANEF
jgi:hypothetical protein